MTGRCFCLVVLLLMGVSRLPEGIAPPQEHSIYTGRAGRDFRPSPSPSFDFAVRPILLRLGGRVEFLQTPGRIPGCRTDFARCSIPPGFERSRLAPSRGRGCETWSDVLHPEAVCSADRIAHDCPWCRPDPGTEQRETCGTVDRRRRHEFSQRAKRLHVVSGAFERG